MKKHKVHHMYHPVVRRPLHPHEYHSAAQLAFNRVFVAPAITAVPAQNNPPEDEPEGSPET